MPTPADTKRTGSTSDLDDSLYRLDEEEIEFLSSQTGIQDPAEIKRHVVSVQREAYAVRFVEDLILSQSMLILAYFRVGCSL